MTIQFFSTTGHWGALLMISVILRLRQKGCPEFQASMDYKMRSSLKIYIYCFTFSVEVSQGII